MPCFTKNSPFAKGRILLWLAFMALVATMYARTNPPASSDCCAYALHLVNLYTDERVRNVRVTGICGTNLCCADPDEWAQASNLPTSVDWSMADGSGIPYGNAIDNDFMVYLDPTVSPQTIQIEWFDANNNVMCRQIIQIDCNGTFDEEEEDWMKYTQRTSLDDPNLYAFVTRETEDDDESDCDFGSVNALIVDCPADVNVTCSGGNTYVVSITGPGGFDTYKWTVNGPSSPVLGNIQNPSFTSSQSGSYAIHLEATNSQDTCLKTLEVIIPKFDPDFSWEILPCGTSLKLSGGGWDDFSDVQNVSWTSSLPGFPLTGFNATAPFPGFGTYSITMTIVDKYGCSHSITKSVTLSSACAADLKVERFTFCSSECDNVSSIAKVVTFRNLSTGGICPITYTWNFGDGSPAVTTNALDSIVTHTYTVSCPTGQDFNVTLSMQDASSPACLSSKSIVASIRPCEVDFDIRVCPDGRVNFSANTAGIWSTPGAKARAPWPYSSFPKKGKRQKLVARYGNGTHTVTFKGFCDGGGECTVSKTFTVTLECCAKNDRDRDKHKFTESGKDYKMKYRFAQNQLPLIHNIKAVSKLKKKKKTKIGISFWKGQRADEIHASFDGTIYKRDGDHCNCSVPTNSNASETQFNKKKAKAKDGQIGRYRSRVETIESSHQVRMNSYTSPVFHLKLGKDCDAFHWLTDWY